MSQSIKSGSQAPTLKLKPIFLCISAILGVASVSQAEIINTNGAGVMNQHNGPTVVHINKASDKGVSHNIYSKFDVDKNGVILNNSKDNIDTKLGGLINGNLNLANGTAKVIINEVNSNNATTLNGMVEVAGDKAKVIVANPSGITCNSCGFINTESTTLTTGKPIVTNGELLGYNVSKGKIIVNKSLDSDSPTELISRSAAINGQIKTKELKIVTGNNFVDADGNVLSKVAGSGPRPEVSIDVSLLGGMYADKITLISTESGVGVRNKGIISAGSKGLSMTSAWYLANDSNKIESAGNIDIVTNTFHNKALVSANKNLTIKTTNTNDGYITFVNEKGKLVSTGGDVNLTTAYTIINNDDSLISAKNNVNLAADSILNGTGLIKAETGDVNIDARGTVSQSERYRSSIPEDRIIAGRDVNITAGRIISESAKIQSGRDVNIKTTSTVENKNTLITAKRRIDLDASAIINKSSSITATNAKSDITASNYISNDANSVISSGRGLNITTAKLINAGKIISPTNKPNTPPIPTYVTNIKADSLENKGGMITGDTLNITSNNIQNENGFIDATTLNVKSNTLNNNSGYIRSYKDAVFSVNSLSNRNSSSFASYAYKFGLARQAGGIEVLDGGITVTGVTVDNTHGLFKSNILERAATAGGMEFTLTNNLVNNSGTLNSVGNIMIDTKEVSNQSGIINTDEKLTIKAEKSINNIYGRFTSKDVTELYTPSFLTYDKNAIYSLDGTGIIYKPDGLNIVHIKKPSDKGVSHNTYQQFNVNGKGVIFNNSDSQSTTQLGGDIWGNANLAGVDAAKVILNEVVGNNMSTINGMMEVAGNAAQVIVANASGITCNSCGFINAERGAFVTGTPLVVAGNLIGYNVNKGQITVNNNLKSDNAIDLIARYALINGNVEANEINIATGNSVFDSQGNVLNELSYTNHTNNGLAIASSGKLNANKIKLNITSNQGHLINKGLINAGSAGLEASAYYVGNTATIQSKGDITLASTSQYDFNNDYGKIISTAGNVNIEAKAGLLNRYNGLISANKNVNLNIFENIQNGGGLIKSENGDINVDMTGTIYNWADKNTNRFIASRDINIKASRIVNDKALMSAGRDFNFTGSSIDNKSSTISAERRMTLDTQYLTNASSTIKTGTGRMDITAGTILTNDIYSTISSARLLNITTPKLTNNGVIASGNGKSTFRTNELVNKGYIKGFDLNFVSTYLNNTGGLVKADNNVVMNVDHVTNTDSANFSRNTSYLGLTSQKGGIIAEDGSIKIKGTQLNNTSGIIQTNAVFPMANEADISINVSNDINNNCGQINSAGNLNASANTISNYSGLFKAGLDLTAKADRSINNNYGTFNARNTTKVTTPSLSNSYGKITGNNVIINTN